MSDSPLIREVTRYRESPPIGEVNLGWVLELRTEGLIADWGESPGFGAYRGWHSAGLIRLASEERRLHATLVLEGTMRCVVNGVEMDVGPGEILIVQGSSQATLAALTEVRSYNWALTTAALENRIFRSMLNEPIFLDEAPRSPLVAATNALLNTHALSNVAASYAYGRGIEQILAGMLLDRPQHRRPTSGTPCPDSLLVTAQNVIEQHFRDPSFSMVRLAAALHVSIPTLYRLYQALGTTPRTEIVTRRVVEATTLLDQRRPQDTTDLREIAELSGFRGVRALREALRWMPGSDLRKDRSGPEREGPGRIGGAGRERLI